MQLKNLLFKKKYAGVFIHRQLLSVVIVFFFFNTGNKKFLPVRQQYFFTNLRN